MVLAALAGEHLRQPLRRLLPQLAHLHRMHLELRRDGVDRIDALQGFKTYLGFQIGTVLTSFLGHWDRCSEFGLTIRPVQLSGSTSLKLITPLSLTHRNPCAMPCNNLNGMYALLIEQKHR